MGIVDRILDGDIRAAAGLMREIDSPSGVHGDVLTALYAHTGHAQIVGITGSPGAGKSTLINCLIREFRQQGHSIGAVVVDPTSPFSSGALLGDRFRMQPHTDDDDVFIHSTTTRGSTGGVSLAVPGMVAIMDAMGKDIIFVESVGAGQVGVDIHHLAHTNLVVITPAMGDDIQALKAGILESAHIFVLNKSDQPDTEATLQSLNMLIQLGTPSSESWQPVVMQTRATQHQGITELSKQIRQHQKYREAKLTSENTDDRTRGLLALILRERIVDFIQSQALRKESWGPWVDRIIQKKIDPYQAAEEILDKTVEQFYREFKFKERLND